jgi:hypothetical protein
MFKFSNLKEPITTLLGALVILASLASVFVMDFGWTEASIGITAGVGLLFMKDKGNGGKALLLMVLIPALFFSCKGNKAPALQIITVHDSTWIAQEAFRDTFYLPGETLTKWLPYNCDSAGRLTINHKYINQAKGKRSQRLKVEVDSIRRQIYVSADCDSLIQVNSTLVSKVNTLRNRVLMPQTSGVSDSKSKTTLEVITQIAYYLLCLLAGIGIGKLI